MDEDRGRIRQKQHEEKRMEVEERKRLIQEADQERKEAILRKNMERNNKPDGRTPHKNASTFVFGSSTPRTLNQELPSLESIGSGSSRSTNPTSINSVPPVLYRVRQQQALPINSPTMEERPFGRRARPMSAYACLSGVDQRILFGEEPVHVKTSPSYDSQNAKACLMMTPEYHHANSNGDYRQSTLNQSTSNGDVRDGRVDAGGDNMMSQSLVFIQPSSGRKRHPELTPVVPRERGMVTSMSRLSNRDSSSNSNNRRNGSATPSSTSTTTPTSFGSGPRRAVSMTRLNELAKPRQRYLEETLKIKKGIQATTPVSNQQVNGNDAMTRSSNDFPQLRKTPSTGDKHRIHKKRVVVKEVVPKESSVDKDESNEKAEAERLEIERKKKILDERRKKEIQERKRLEEERKKKEEEERLAAIEEEERLRREEEEESRRLEEETQRLAEEHKKAEEEKLRLAIEEQERRQLEERKRLEEEARLAAEREEQEQRAREEAEKARIELEERLRKDEEERLARKKRVEAIMSRTRKTPGKNGASEDVQGDEEQQQSNTTTTATSNGGSLNNFPTSGDVSAF